MPNDTENLFINTEQHIFAHIPIPHFVVSTPNQLSSIRRQYQFTNHDSPKFSQQNLNWQVSLNNNLPKQSII
jgi:hypothetical protein